ncbi:hypothetical protein ElyMa_004952800, partial [Elysia marginata]
HRDILLPELPSGQCLPVVEEPCGYRSPELPNSFHSKSPRPEFPRGFQVLATKAQTYRFPAALPPSPPPPRTTSCPEARL